MRDHAQSGNGIRVAQCMTPVPMETDLEPVRLLTIKETANLLRVHPRTVKSMIQRKALPALKVGSRWRVRESELAKWFEGLNER